MRLSLRPVDLSFLPIDTFSWSGGLTVVISGVQIDPVLWGDARCASSVLVFKFILTDLEADGFERGSFLSRRLGAMKENDPVSESEAKIPRYKGDAFTFTSSDRTIRDSHYEGRDGLVPDRLTVVF